MPLAPQPTTTMRNLTTLLLLLTLCSCRNVAPPGTYFDTRPAGAEVLIDGRKTGYVTPCLIALNRSKDHMVSFELPGFQMRDLDLESSGQASWMPLRDAAVAQHGLHFPLYLQVEELFLPRIVDNSLAPGRVFVRLHPERK